VREILLLWVGRRGEAELERVATEYRRRIERHVAVAEVRIRPEPGRAGDPVRARAQEGERMREHLRPTDLLFALDEHGTERTTLELAEVLRTQLVRGRVVFLLGSDLGLDPRLVAAGETLALSRLTLSHQLARVVLLEQLYRCFDLLAGGAYHRGELPTPGYNVPRRRRR
jgi:23S rRNA (pseudouridine1915-N3)-methyltransferase